MLQTRRANASRGDCRVDTSTACYRTANLTKTNVRRDATCTVIHAEGSYVETYDVCVVTAQSQARSGRREADASVREAR